MVSCDKSTMRRHITSSYAIIDDFIFSTEKEAIDNGFTFFRKYNLADVYVRDNSYGLVWTD